MFEQFTLEEKFEIIKGLTAEVEKDIKEYNNTRGFKRARKIRRNMSAIRKFCLAIRKEVQEKRREKLGIIQDED